MHPQYKNLRSFSIYAPISSHLFLFKINNIPTNWFQTIINTGVLVNITKRMEKVPILRCTFFHQYLECFEKLAHYNQPTFRKLWGVLFIILGIGWVTYTTVLSVFLGCGGFQTNFFCRALIFIFILVYTWIIWLIN